MWLFPFLVKQWCAGAADWGGGVTAISSFMMMIMSFERCRWIQLIRFVGFRFILAQATSDAQCQFHFALFVRVIFTHHLHRFVPFKDNPMRTRTGGLIVVGGADSGRHVFLISCGGGSRPLEIESPRHPHGVSGAATALLSGVQVFSDGVDMEITTSCCRWISSDELRRSWIRTVPLNELMRMVHMFWSCTGINSRIPRSAFFTNLFFLFIHQLLLNTVQTMEFLYLQIFIFIFFNNFVVLDQ